VSLSRNATYNLVGSAIPVALAFLTVPLYLKAIGTERYGVLGIAWLFLGYFGLFDLGLGRATQFRIAALRNATPQARADTFWTALILNLGLGFVGGSILWAGSSYFFGHIFKTTPAMRQEILGSLPLLAAAVPVATVTGVLTGALQAREKFLETNIISVTSTSLFQIVPLSVAWLIGPDLTLLLAGAISSRVLAMVALSVRCHAGLGRGQERRFVRSEIPRLLSYGGWVTLTSLVAPLLTMVDRFSIGAVLSGAAVGVYSVPFQLAKQIAIVPAALTSASFPRQSGATAAERDEICGQTTRILAGLVTPPVMAGMFLLGAFLHLWVGAAVGAQAAPVGRVLLIAFWINAFTLVPFTRLQASGRPDMITKIILIEIPPYLLCLFPALHYFGLIGAAGVLALRIIADYLLLSWAADRSYSGFRLLAANLALLVAAAFASSMWSIADPLWWISAGALLSANLGLCWNGLPPTVRAELLSRVRRRALKIA